MKKDYAHFSDFTCLTSKRWNPRADCFLSVMTGQRDKGAPAGILYGDY